MNPGDVLYIPPYWAHQVEALSLSVSMSILSPSVLDVAFAEIYWQLLPLQEYTTTRYLRTKIVLEYIAMIVNQWSTALQQQQTIAIPPCLRSITTFLTDLYDTRYKPLYINQHNHNKKQKEEVANHQQQQQKQNMLCPNATHSDFATFQTLFNSSNQATWQDIVQQKIVSPLVHDIATYHEVKVVFVKDYVEQLIRWAVGPDQTPDLLYYCFVLDPLLSDIQ